MGREVSFSVHEVWDALKTAKFSMPGLTGEKINKKLNGTRTQKEMF